MVGGCSRGCEIYNLCLFFQNKVTHINKKKTDNLPNSDQKNSLDNMIIT